MMTGMAQVNFAITLPEHALEVLRDRARHDGLTLSDWLARAIYDKATRDSRHDSTAATADSARSRFIADTEAERLRNFFLAESA
jgi:predicted metal-dependent HD superfamily phosphohydrolase